jgi:predicted permease
MNLLANDIRWAARSLVRSPGLAIAAVLVLSLGLGANLTVFSFFNSALLRPLPGIRGEERLVLVGRSDRGRGFFSNSYPDYRDLRAEAKSFSHLAARQPMSMSVAAGGPVERLRGEAVSSNYFEALGVRIALGRGFQPDEDAVVGKGAVVVVGHAYWERQLGGDPAALGREIMINGAAHTIVGVVERGFRGNYLPAPAEIFIPISMFDPVHLGRRDSTWLNLCGRLAPGVSPGRADAELAVLGAAYRTKHQASFREMSFRTARFNSVDADLGSSDVTAMVAVLGALALLSLFLVCANVANLLLARAMARGREVSIRLSLGAGRASVVRQFLAEGLMMAAGATALGLAASLWCSELLASMIPTEDGVGRIRLDAALDPRMLLAAVLLALFATVAFAGPAAWLASRANLLPGLRSGEAGSGGSAGRTRMRSLFAGVQVALCLALLACAGLVGRSVYLLGRSDHGVALDRIAIASIDLEAARYGQSAGLALFAELRARLAAQPGVAAVATARMVPFSGAGMSLFGVWGGDVPERSAVYAYTNVQSPGLFDALAMPLLYGRDFTDRDNQASRLVAIINERLARRLFPRGDPLGQTIRTNSADFPEFEIIGVARDGLAPNPQDGRLSALHLSMNQIPRWGMRQTVLLRTSGPLAPQFASMRSVAAALDRNLPLYEQGTLRAAFEGSYFMVRMAGAVAGFSGVMAAVVATIGIYGLMAFNVSRRTREIGLRLALGATPARVLGTTVSAGLRSVAVGVAAGLALSLAITRILRALLFGVEPTEPAVLLSATAFVLVAASVACYFPARRASRVEPSAALRYE